MLPDGIHQMPLSLSEFTVNVDHMEPHDSKQTLLRERVLLRGDDLGFRADVRRSLT